MPQSYIEYNSGLTGTTFSVPFKYISVDDVHALGFDGEKYVPLTVSTRNNSAKTITLSAAPSAYEKVRLYRATSTAQLVDFQNGSRLSEADLDTAYQQGLFTAQEMSEDASSTQFSVISEATLQLGTSLSNFASEEFTGNGTSTAFNITEFNPQTTVTEAYRVSIDGVMQSPVDAYSISMNPSKITFTSAPPSGSKIVVVTAASVASAVSVDDATLGLTSTNKAQVKDGGITPAKLSNNSTLAWGHGNIGIGKSEIFGDYNAGIEINTDLSSGETGTAYVDFHSTGATSPDYDGRIQHANNKFKFKVNDGTEVLTLTDDGKLGINTTIPAYTLDVSGTILADPHSNLPAILVAGDATNEGDICCYENDVITFGHHRLTGNQGDFTERMRIDQQSRLLVGLTSSPTTLPNSIVCSGQIVTQNTYSQTSSSSANVVINSDGFLLRSTSSGRYKENIQDYDKGIEAIKSLRPVTYQSINEDDDNTYAGFIAEEVHDAGLTEFVEYNPEGQPDALHYANMTAVLTKALQEALTKIETLEARVEALENA